jgi:hypothetical protein
VVTFADAERDVIEQRGAAGTRPREVADLK